MTLRYARRNCVRLWDDCPWAVPNCGAAIVSVDHAQRTTMERTTPVARFALLWECRGCQAQADAINDAASAKIPFVEGQISRQKKVIVRNECVTGTPSRGQSGRSGENPRSYPPHALWPSCKPRCLAWGCPEPCWQQSGHHTCENMALNMVQTRLGLETSEKEVRAPSHLGLPVPESVLMRFAVPPYANASCAENVKTDAAKRPACTCVNKIRQQQIQLTRTRTAAHDNTPVVSSTPEMQEEQRWRKPRCFASALPRGPRRAGRRSLRQRGRSRTCCWRRFVGADAFLSRFAPPVRCGPLSRPPVHRQRGRGGELLSAASRKARGAQPDAFNNARSLSDH